MSRELSTEKTTEKGLMKMSDLVRELRGFDGLLV
jgi:hypothetical protein